MSMWSAHGLVVSSVVDLDAPPALATADPDVIFTFSDRLAILALDRRPEGRTLAELRQGDQRALTVVANSSAGDSQIDAYFHGLATARISAGTQHVELTLADGADPLLAPVLINGTLMSLVLMLRGHPVLHASAVTLGAGVDARAIGFVGRSGMGKSTTATLLCRDGGRLLTDDVLRTDLEADGMVLAHPGATRTRLREGSRSLAAQATDDVSITADGRSSVGLPTTGGGAVRLAALVVPQPDRTLSRPTLTQVHGVDAVVTLASFPRIVGWSDPVTSGQALRHWGDLARRVPVLIAHVPWGPPFTPGLGRELGDLVLQHGDS